MAEGFVTITIRNINVAFVNDDELDPGSCADEAIARVFDMDEVIMSFEIVDKDYQPVANVKAVVHMDTRTLGSQWVRRANQW